MSEPRTLLDLVLAETEDTASTIRLFTFRRPDGGVLPSAPAGGDLVLHLPKGYVRRYALLDADDAPRAYRIAVQRRPEGRASHWLHTAARPGVRFLTEVHPHLDPLPPGEGWVRALFLAGGIGIAGLHATIARLDLLARPSHLHYAARTRSAALFAGAYDADTSLYFDGAVLDIAAAVAAAPEAAHLYCCGPRSMMQAFTRATAGRDPARVHARWFFPEQEPRLGGFALHLARSGRDVPVPPGRTMLDALLAAGVNVPHACLEGLCSRCEARVLQGTAVHHDGAPAAFRRGTALTCCAGAAGERLVLDL